MTANTQRLMSEALISLTGNEKRENGRIYVEIKCDCGTVKYVRKDNLKQRGGMTSCGCLRSKNFTNETHGLNKRGERHPIYNTWSDMHQRCYNKNNNNYKYYGGKGVRVCEAWGSILGFAEWALSNGFVPGLTIDRIDSDGDYEPANCRFITRSANSKRVSDKLQRSDDGKFRTAST